MPLSVQFLPFSKCLRSRRGLPLVSCRDSNSRRPVFKACFLCFRVGKWVQPLLWHLVHCVASGLSIPSCPPTTRSLGHTHSERRGSESASLDQKDNGSERLWGRVLGQTSARSLLVRYPTSAPMKLHLLSMSTICRKKTLGGDLQALGTLLTPLDPWFGFKHLQTQSIHMQGLGRPRSNSNIPMSVFFVFLWLFQQLHPRLSGASILIDSSWLFCPCVLSVHLSAAPSSTM